MKTDSRIRWLVFAACCFVQLAWAELPAKAVWVDVRSPEEYASDHLQQARSIPLDDIESGIGQLGLDKDAPIYLYCGSGRRAGLAKERLEAPG